MESTSLDKVAIQPEEHHIQCSFCYSRAKYRQGKEFKAVKVYTVNEESVHMILQNIPNVGLGDELETLCRRFGAVQQFNPVSSSDYPPKEEFTTVFYVKYASLREARFAKKKLDNRVFFGGIVHICYAPELETVEETREKLDGRRRFVQSYFTKNKKNKPYGKFSNK